MELSYVRRAIGSAVGSGDDNMPRYDLPSWTILIFLIDLVVLIPIFIVFNYTYKTVFPIFAMVEDENPPAYEPVSLNDNVAADADVAGAESQSRKPTDGQPRTVTSSLRAVNRLLLAHGGFRAYFRGFFCLLAQGLATSALMGLFSAALGGFFTPIATLLASLALVQLSTAWVHIVISLPSRRHFWSRLPPFKRAFDATWKPVALYWLAAEATRWLPVGLAFVLGIRIPKLDNNGQVELGDLDAAWFIKGAVVVFVTIFASVFLIIPAKVILVRVQASLLPVEEDTVIPFDRSFEGKVEPAIVGGKGYVSIADAWETFSRAAWRRLLILYVKVFLVSMAGVLITVALLVPQGVLIAKKTERVN
ncbi:ubiquitin conjugating enzyme [Purpureocillium lavendulum]|uniref:Ubiquitin conjugating enzyme n=1 Tax=Purpureocillium lavendulum TaxID=1247861 RepID=A0AB34G0Y3_9HYPO|nr:ubiquitin conjugating enzyme [Purpureocillium lavendulum]